MTTIAQVAKLGGFEDPDTFLLAEKEFARRYGCEPRGTGRTIRMLLMAVGAALDGERVAFYTHSVHAGRQLASTVRTRFLARLSSANDRRLVFSSGGELHFVCRGENLRGLRIGGTYHDDYIPKGAPPHQHRTAENGKHCVTCGERLRGRKLEEARVRRALVRENPGYARAMGILDEPKFSSEPAFKTNRLLDGRFFQ